MCYRHSQLGIRMKRRRDQLRNDKMTTTTTKTHGTRSFPQSTFSGGGGRAIVIIDTKWGLFPSPASHNISFCNRFVLSRFYGPIISSLRFSFRSVTRPSQFRIFVQDVFSSSVTTSLKRNSESLAPRFEAFRSSHSSSTTTISTSSSTPASSLRHSPVTDGAVWRDNEMNDGDEKESLRNFMHGFTGGVSSMSSEQTERGARAYYADYVAEFREIGLFSERQSSRSSRLFLVLEGRSSHHSSAATGQQQV